MKCYFWRYLSRIKLCIIVVFCTVMLKVFVLSFIMPDYSVFIVMLNMFMLSIIMHDCSVFLFRWRYLCWVSSSKILMFFLLYWRCLCYHYAWLQCFIVMLNLKLSMIMLYCCVFYCYTEGLYAEYSNAYWKRISHKQSARWKHLFWTKASAFSSSNKF